LKSVHICIGRKRLHTYLPVLSRQKGTADISSLQTNADVLHMSVLSQSNGHL
ncbi:hypothetical protein NDU88_001970, partial [Pleurodeles waltl]